MSEPQAQTTDHQALATELARRLFEVGNGPNPCTRIQFMAGDWRTSEIGQGGFCEEALERFFKAELDKLLSGDSHG